MVIEIQNFKVLLSLLHGYHIPQLQNITKILPTLHMEFFRIGNPIFNFFVRYVETTYQLRVLLLVLLLC